MSVVVSNANDICNSALNRSKTKSLYSFPKSERFKTQKNFYCDTFYNLPSTKTLRSTNLGYSTKYDFTKGNNKSPAPNVYNIKTDLEMKQIKKLGFSFGESREKLKQGSIFQQMNNDFVPGPGIYKMKSTLTDIKYSLGARHQDLSQRPNKVPGPGHYPNYPSINQQGKYILSKYGSSKASNFHPERSQRFDKKQYTNDNPGPGQYQPQSTLTNNGSYYLSKYENSRVRSFSHQSKSDGNGGIYSQCRELGQYPGPGQYRVPSEFGYYEAKQNDKSK